MRNKSKSFLVALVVLIFAGLTIGVLFNNNSKITGNVINEQVKESVNDETLIESPEPFLVELNVSQLTLDSADVEAGYTLRRSLSGYKRLKGTEIYNDYFVKRFDKEIFKTKEQRVLYIETYKFQNEEDADKKFGEILLEKINTNLYGSVEDIEPVAESSIFLKRDYFYNFYPFEEYSALILVKNVVYQIRLYGYSNAVTKEEINYYAKRLVGKLEESPKTTLEIPQTQLARLEEDLRVSLKINNQSSGKSSSWRSENEITPAWDYNFVEDEFKINYNDEKESWIHSFLLFGQNNPKDKEFLILSFCINNSYEEDISVNPKNFFLKDNKGNIYTSLAMNRGEDMLKRKTYRCSEYAYPIFKENKAPEIKDFEVVLLDSDRQVILGRTNITLEEFGTYKWEN